MTPYYDQDGITIYRGDCSDVIDGFDCHWGERRFDLLLTDPPYGIGRDGSKASTGSHGGRKAYEFRGWDTEAPSMLLLMALCGFAKVQIVWGGNFFGLPPTQKWLVWDKGQRIDQSDGELAWTSMQGALRIFTLNRAELMRDGAVHPAQKPEALMRWCFSQVDGPTNTVFDPFMGSGSTLVAAKRLGKKAVGIDRDERYCEIAAKRLSQGALFTEGIA